MLHHRKWAVVFGGELSFFDKFHGAVNAGLHVPNGGGDYGIRVFVLRIDHVANRQFALFLGRVAHAEALGVKHIRTFVDHGKSRFLGFGWIKPTVDEAHSKFNFGVGFFRTRHEGMHQAVDFGNGKAAHHADLVALGHATGDHACQVSGLLNVVVKHAEVRGLRLGRRAHQERDFGKVFSHFARCRFHRKRFAHDQSVARRGVLTHHALVICVGDVLGGFVFDIATRFGGFQRFMNAASPLLLKRYGVDTRNLGFGLRPGNARHSDCCCGCQSYEVAAIQ